MTSVVPSDDRLSNDSDSKENKKNASSDDNITPKKDTRRKSSVSSSKKTPSTSTVFNPFGRFQNLVTSNKSSFVIAIENLAKLLSRNSPEKSNMFLKRRPESLAVMNEIKRIVTSIKMMAKNIPTAVPCSLTFIAQPLIKLCRNLDNYTMLNNVPSGDVIAISQTISEMLQYISQNCPEPYGNDLLEEWAELFEVLFTSNVTILRNSAVNLWNKTFGKKGKLRYPNDRLRDIMIALPKKYSIIIPENEGGNNICVKSNAQTFQIDDDEQAMDGIEIETKTEKETPPPKMETSFQESMTFDLSQQPKFDHLATKLIEEKEKEKREERRPRKASKPEKFLVDEDTNDFVVIKTPISDKKVRLTDHQKEKFEEVKDGLNFVDEASQSMTQKENAMKNALTTFNLTMDDGESTSSSAIPQPTEKEDTKKIEEESQVPEKRASVKRTRRLFGSDNSESEPKKLRTRSQKIVIDDVDVKTGGGGDDDEDETSDDGSTLLKLLPLLPEEKMRLNQSLEEKSTFDQEENNEEEQNRRSKSKKMANPKKVVATTSASKRKSGRLAKNEEKEEKEAEKPVEVDEKMEIEDKKSDTNDIPALEECPSSPVAAVTIVPQTPTTIRSSSKSVMTPSILRKTPSVKTPTTDRKRNRVHFDADPLENSEKMATPTKKVDEKSEEKVFSILPTLPGGLELEMPILYAPLKDSTDNIDVLVRRLVPLSGAVSAMSILRKSFSAGGIKTVGQFASLTVSQLNKFNGIRPVKEKTARKVLADYEADYRKLVRYATISKEEDEKKIENVEKVENEAEKMEVDEEQRVKSPQQVVEEIAQKLTERAEAEKELIPAAPSASPVDPSPEKVENSGDEQRILEDVQQLDEISRRLCRLIGKSDVSKECWDKIDDTIFDTFVRIRGLVRERGFKNI